MEEKIKTFDKKNESVEKKKQEIEKILKNQVKEIEKIAGYSANEAKDELLKIKAHKLDTVDTTGAGDTFIGYYVAGIGSKMNLKDNLNRASEAAAIATTKLGGAESIPRIN